MPNSCSCATCAPLRKSRLPCSFFTRKDLAVHVVPESQTIVQLDPSTPSGLAPGNYTTEAVLHNQGNATAKHLRNARCGALAHRFTCQHKPCAQKH